MSKTANDVRFEAEMCDYYSRLGYHGGAVLDFSGRVFHGKTGDFWLYDKLETVDIHVGWEAAQERVTKLEEAYAAACAFIDCHAGDPDITGEMIINHRKFVECREGLDNEINF